VSDLKKIKDAIIVFFLSWKIRIQNYFDKRRDEKARLKQYTKSLVTGLTIMACIWISTSYIYAGACLFLYGNTEYLSELSQQVCITILGVVISYAIKSYMETFSERKQDLEDKKFESTIIHPKSNSEGEG
jgi:hypothetical protein